MRKRRQFKTVLNCMRFFRVLHLHCIVNNLEKQIRMYILSGSFFVRFYVHVDNTYQGRLQGGQRMMHGSEGGLGSNHQCAMVTVELRKAENLELYSLSLFNIRIVYCYLYRINQELQRISWSSTKI